MAKPTRNHKVAKVAAPRVVEYGAGWRIERWDRADFVAFVGGEMIGARPTQEEARDLVHDWAYRQPAQQVAA